MFVSGFYCYLPVCGLERHVADAVKSKLAVPSS
jgi:hypothetical protein